MKNVKIIPKGDAKHRVSTKIKFISYQLIYLKARARAMEADAPKRVSEAKLAKGLERTARRPRPTEGRRGRLAQKIYALKESQIKSESYGKKQ